MTNQFKLVDTNGVYSEFTSADLKRIEVALRIREEIARENEEKDDERRWNSTRKKILFLLEWKE